MANKSLITYFIEGKKKGFTAEQLKQSLLAQGYTQLDINDALLESLKEKKNFFTTSTFKVSLTIILALIVIITTYLILINLDMFKGREIAGVKESYINKILKEECSGTKGSQYAECSTDTIAKIAFNRNNQKICAFSKFESICIGKFNNLKV